MLINMLLDKVESTQEQIGNVYWGIEMLRKNKKEMLEVKNAIIEMRNALAGSSMEGTQLKNLWAWGCVNKNFQDESKEKQDWKTENPDYARTVGQPQKVKHTCEGGDRTEKQEEEGWKKHLKQHWVEFPTRFMPDTKP